jgi:uncharacterized protein (DUF1778 family)
MQPKSNEPTCLPAALPAHQAIKLSYADRDRLLDLLGNPPAPTEELRTLMRRVR